LETNEIFVSCDVIFHGAIFPSSAHKIGQNKEERGLGHENLIDENCLRDWISHELESGGIGLIEGTEPTVE